MSFFQKYIAALLTILVAAIVVGIGYFIFHGNNTVIANSAPVATPIQATPPSSLNKPRHQTADMNIMQSPVPVQENTKLNHHKAKPKMTQKDIDNCVAKKVQDTRDQWNDPDKFIRTDILEEFEEDCRKGK